MCGSDTNATRLNGIHAKSIGDSHPRDLVE